MIVESLLEIVNNKLDLGDKRKLAIKSYLDTYDEQELAYILSSANGLLADDISISFFPGVGFRCFNDTRKVGRLPMCNTFQNILNKKYQDMIKDL
jgi:hypothetical protein